MKLHESCESIIFPKGVFIENQNINEFTFMYLKNGSITVSIAHPNGKYIPFRYINSGEYFGLSRLNGINENLSFFTTSPVEICVISENHFLNLISSNSNYLKEYLNFHTSRINFLIEKMILFSIQNNRQRIAYFFITEIKKQNKKDIQISMSKSKLMEFLGISRGSFYRELNYLIDKKIIFLEGNNRYKCSLKKLQNLLIEI